jgi:hypothetical protein
LRFVDTKELLFFLLKGQQRMNEHLREISRNTRPTGVRVSRVAGRKGGVKLEKSDNSSSNSSDVDSSVNNKY